MPDITVDDDAIEVAWTIVQGNDVNRTFRIRSDVDGASSYWDLTGYTISGQVRASQDKTSTLYGTLSGTIASPQTGDTKGQFTITLTRSLTNTLPRRCWADVRFTSPEESTRSLLRIAFDVERAVSA